MHSPRHDLIERQQHFRSAKAHWVRHWDTDNPSRSIGQWLHSPVPVIRTIAIPFKSADVVSELTIKIIRQFHSRISSWSASDPSSLGSRLCAAEHYEGNRGGILTLFENILVRPLDSLPQSTQSIEAAIQLVARKLRQIHHSIGAQLRCNRHRETASRIHSPGHW